MRAKAEKVLREKLFSDVDCDLDQLYEILSNTNSAIFENKIDTRAIPFQSIHDSIRLRGKKLCLDTLSILLKRYLL